MQIKKLPKEERPAEKIIQWGASKLSNAELVALIIHSGTKGRSAMEIAQSIIASNDQGIRFLSCCEAEELQNISGVGRAKAARIIAAVELGKRIATWRSADSSYIENSKDVANIFMEDLRYETKEHFKTVLLNTKGKVLHIDTVSVGNLIQTTVHPREVFKKAIRKGAASLIIIHNHPSGDPAPSDEDIKTTRRLSEVGELVGIPVLDHIIIGDGEFVSFKSQGLL